MCQSYTRHDRPRVLCVDPRLLECGLGASAGSRAGRLTWLRSGVGTLPQRAGPGGLGSGATLSDQPFQHRCRVYRFAVRPFGRRNGEAVDRLPADQSSRFVKRTQRP